MGCGSSSEFSDDEPRTVVVFGATGLLGGAVARALLEDPLHFRVRAVTRRPSSEKARKLAEEGKEDNTVRRGFSLIGSGAEDFRNIKIQFFITYSSSPMSES